MNRDAIQRYEVEDFERKRCQDCGDYFYREELNESNQCDVCEKEYIKSQIKDKLIEIRELFDFNNILEDAYNGKHSDLFLGVEKRLLGLLEEDCLDNALKTLIDEVDK
jgi:hypothetical protein